jgi:hypothetical protein
VKSKDSAMLVLKLIGEDLDMLGAIVIVEAKTLFIISYMIAHTLQTIEKTLYDLFTISL